MSADVSDIAAYAANLLALAGLPDRVNSVQLSNAGGNNRTYRIETATACYAVKQYFRHEGDSRNRLGAEYAFLAYAHAVAPGSVPRPLAQDAQTGMALYEFVHGEPLKNGAIGEAEVDAAIVFFTALNDPTERKKAVGLPLASESSFSISDHLSLIRERIRQLSEITPVLEVDREGYTFICILAEHWQQLEYRVGKKARELGWELDQILPQEQRCISPSDFGFHNALRSPDGSLRFLDFEYAGWDDPAKMTGDFFAQLAVPVPFEYFERFVAGVMQPFADPQTLAARAGLLRTVYQVKWCCIALNVFLPVHLARRRFANPALDETALKRAQLAKAKKILQSIRNPGHGLH